MYFYVYREDRIRFIRAKYVDKRYAMKTCQKESEKLIELEEAVNNGDLNLLLQVFAENVDLSAPLPSSVSTVNISFCYLKLKLSFYRKMARLLCTERL